jgi:hypothetical protein
MVFGDVAQNKNKFVREKYGQAIKILYRKI